MGLKITINLLALSLAFFIYKNFIPKDENSFVVIWEDLKKNFDYLSKLEDKAKQNLIKEVAIVLGLYFGVNLILTQVGKK